MIKTTLKAIKETVATDLTTADFEAIRDFMNAHHLDKVAYSTGVYGINAVLLKDEGGNMYKVTARSSALFQLI